MEFIRGTTLVHLKIRCWSGEKKASRDRDIQLGKDGKMPPKEILDIGNKKIFLPKALDPMGAQRKSAERACLSSGTRFMGGYAIPDGDVDDLVIKLNAAKDKFEEELSQFLTDFETNKEAWLKDEKVKEFAEIIRNQIPDKDTVARAFEFSFKLYKLNPVEGYEPDEQDIANQILHEIGMTCKDMSKRMLDRKTAISGDKLCEQLDPLIKKLDTLSFGNGRLLKVLGEFKALQDSIPMDRIDQAHPSFGHTLTFLSMCADSYKLERIIDGSFSVLQMIQSMQPKQQPETASSTTVTVDSSTAQSVSTNSLTTPVNQVESAGAYF